MEPQLVAEIEFSRWTRDRILRHSSYKGLRTDKPAEEVALESSRSKDVYDRGCRLRQEENWSAGV